jgi:hypothetical protein
VRSSQYGVLPLSDYGSTRAAHENRSCLVTDRRRPTTEQAFRRYRESSFSAANSFAESCCAQYVQGLSNGDVTGSDTRTRQDVRNGEGTQMCRIRKHVDRT